MNCLKNTLLIIEAQVTCTKNYARQKVKKKNEDQVYLIKKVLNRMKKIIEKVTEDRKSMIEENEKTISIVEHIFYFNELDQEE